MAVCRFCEKEFGSRQAVRAHLKACAAYLGRFTRQAALPEAAGAMPTQSPAVASFDLPAEDFDPVTKMRQQVSAEKLRLTLREIRQAHGELDAKEQASRRAAAEQQAREAAARAAPEREREAVRARATLEAESRRRAEEAKERHKAKRRQIIQDTKQAVVERWPASYRLSTELKAQILQAIERALAPLPIEELPQAELVQIAEGVRDRLHGEALARQSALEARTQRQQALQRYGLEYAEQELEAIEDLDLSERWRIESVVTEEFKALTGDELRAQVRAWVDDILDEEGIGLEDDEDDTE